jgi:hypothetical protein
MINLLPPELKSSYVYARRNVALRRWVVIVLIALLGLAAIGTYGLVALQQSDTNYNKQSIALQDQLDREHVNQTKKRVQDISSSLKLTVKVLSNEVLFSKLIKQIGAAMPNGAVLADLKISTADNALDLTADATNYTTATQVQVNMADPKNQIFSKADIINIKCDSTVPGYPCSVTLRTLFGDNSPFLFINQGKKQ